MDKPSGRWHLAFMTSFTLDTNCIIDIDEGRPAASRVEALLLAWRNGDADLALVASSASERQPGGTYLSNFGTFEERRNALGFAGVPLLPSIGRHNISFFGQSLYGSAEGMEREASIYRILFPSSPVEWADYAGARGVAVDDREASAWSRWRNQILDAQALWAHYHAERQVFVTSDQRLWVLNGHHDFPHMVVTSPEEAVGLI
ncbi:MAG: hypothetical protein KJ981_05205 [Alphaproteobacteria bacterium]|nr:hypothetical protein [Alphaproteobacteria bacterium]MBU0831908.1 hypothetical protein [Alphaproteobacteria bacterium]MBU1763279.1 hypothetical protein [Alphaproteobacteria bacterium]